MPFKKEYRDRFIWTLELFKMTYGYMFPTYENVAAPRNKVRRKMHFLTQRMLGKWMILTDGSCRYRNSGIQLRKMLRHIQDNIKTMSYSKKDFSAPCELRARVSVL